MCFGITEAAVEFKDGGTVGREPVESREQMTEGLSD